MPLDTAIHSDLVARFSGGKHPGWLTDHRARWLHWGLALAIVVATTRLGLRAVSDPSPWLHLRVGQFLLNGGRFGLPDQWAPYPVRPFVLTEWLPSVLAAKLYAVAALPAIAWLRCISMLLLLTATLWNTRRVSGAALALLAAFASVLAAGEGMTERPQAISFVLLAITVGAWWRTAEDLKPRWWLIPLTWLWAMSHGLWVVGLGLGVVMVASLAIDHRLDRRQAGRLLAIPAMGLAAAALTPVGPRLLLTPLTVGANGSDFVGEWQPTSIRDPYAILTLAMLAIVLLGWIRSRAVPPWWQIALAAMSLVSTLAMSRTIAVGAVLAAPLLAQALQQYGTSKQYLGTSVRPATRRDVLGWFSLVAVAAAIAIPISGAIAQTPVGVPDGLRPQLSAIPAGTVILCEDDKTGWLMWAEPQLAPAIDIRTEIYSHTHLAAYVRTMAVEPGWQDFIRSTRSTYALVAKDSPIATALGERLGWHPLGTDSGYVLLAAP
ncbi:MAG: hypothetical protein ACYCV4_07290 [Dermatophilaceae bacterium]